MTYRSLQRANGYFYDLKRRGETVRRHGAIRYLSSGVNHLRAPSVLRDMAKAELNDRTFLENYTSPGGALSVIASIVLDTRSRLGPQSHQMIHPHSICLCVGATGALASAFRYLATQTDSSRVLVLGLNYSFFSTVCDENGLRYSIVKSQEAGRILPTAAEACARIQTDAPGVVVLTQPTNPSGEYYDETELAQVMSAIDQVGAWLIFDEVPSLALPEDPDPPAPFLDPSATSFPQRLIWINSFSKSRSMAGLRVGYMLAPDNVVEFTRLANERQVWSPLNFGSSVLTTDMILRAQMRAIRAGEGSVARSARRYLHLLAPYGDDFSRFDTIWPFIQGAVDWDQAITSYLADLSQVAETCARNWALFQDRLAPYLVDRIEATSGFNHCVKFAQPSREWDFVRAAFDEAGIDFYTESVFADHDDANGHDFWTRVSCAIDPSVFSEGVERLELLLARGGI